MSTSSERPSLTVIVPALNEAATLARVVREITDDLTKHGITHELVLIDDGSTDRTGAIMDELATAQPTLKVLHHPRSLGVGRSFRDGLAVATGEAVIYFPADSENDPRDPADLLRRLREVEAVVPVPEPDPARPWRRRLLSRLYRWLVNRTFGTDFHYTNGTVIYRRERVAGLPLRAEGFFFQAEALVCLTRAGGRYQEAPVRLARRGGGHSKATSLRSLTIVIRDYCRLVATSGVRR